VPSQSLTVGVFHHKVATAALVAGTEHLNDVRVIENRGERDLALET
jgi:hypothetical protein